MRHRYLIVAAFIVASSIIAIDIWWFDGLYLIGPAISLAAFAWRGVIYVLDVALRTLFYQIGWRRLFRPLSVITMGGIGLTYVITDPKRLQKVRGWKGRFLARAVQMREWWHRQHFLTKLAIVAILIGAQVSFHFWLLLFPVGFLVSGIAYAMRKGQVYVVDEYIGQWYWQKLRAFNRKLMNFMRRTPIIGHVLGGMRSLRLSFRCGWRLWKYDPRFRDPFGTGSGHAVEGRLRLARAWWLGDWRRYHGCPLLAGSQKWPPKRFEPLPWYEEEDTAYAPLVSTIIVMILCALILEYTTGQQVLSIFIEHLYAEWRR